ncbi:MAG TPA: substrate-binding domain-containing protein [Alloacidobacterium sp.]|jgi:ribose transport system substrate-binding protein|nr:substrate-binding domain-containing protein [Alloacidobacterium sp.]
MKIFPTDRRSVHFLQFVSKVFAFSFLVAINSCKSGPPTIAVIPRTTGLALWEPEHAGATAASTKHGYKIYWNAPTREDDVQGQIALVQRIIDKHYDGLILSPDQTLALMTPVRRAVSKGIPTVILGSALPLDPGGKLSYILSDDEEAGRMAAARIGTILHGKGTVAILGIDPDIAGVLDRTRSFEAQLAIQYPDIQIIEKRMGSFNVPYEQQTTEEMLARNPNVNAILAVTSDATRGAYSALTEMHKAGTVKLVGCDQDLLLPLTTGEMDSVIAEDTYQMGYKAVELLAEEREGKAVPPVIKIEPKLVIKDNLNSPEIRRMLGLIER